VEASDLRTVVTTASAAYAGESWASGIVKVEHLECIVRVDGYTQSAPGRQSYVAAAHIDGADPHDSTGVVELQATVHVVARAEAH